VRACGGLALVVALTGCAADRAPVPLSHTFESPDALARAVLDALAARDEAALATLSVSEAEFRTIVWPELPSSRPEVNLPVEYAWRDLNTKSRGHMGQTLAAWGGTRLELVQLAFLGETTAYRTFSVHRKSVLTVRTERGEHQQVRLFGSILERGGRYQLFSYVVD
jgi:hypothetical protein